MKKNVVVITLVLAFVFTLTGSLMAYPGGFPAGWYGNYDQLYVVNAIPQLVDSYTVRIKSFDSNGNLLETESYGGEYFTYMTFDVEKPAGFAYATAKIRIKLWDGEVITINK